MPETHAHSLIIECLLLLTALALLSAVFVLSLNPAGMVIESRNLQRKAATEQILTAAYAYAADHGDQFPSAIGYADACGILPTQEICRTGAGSCPGLVDLSLMTRGSSSLSVIPVDPSAGAREGTGYAITRLADGSLVVCALKSEGGEKIEARF